MACLFCVEYTKELLTPAQVNQLRRELILGEDNKHLEKFEDIRSTLSPAYKQQLQEYENENDYFDVYDSFPFND